jgi:hypothetical protein
MFARQSNIFSPRNLIRKVLGPLRRIDDVTFGIGYKRASIPNHAKHFNSTVENCDFRDRIRGDAVNKIVTAYFET